MKYSDLYRITGKSTRWASIFAYLRYPEYRYLVRLRRFQSGKMHQWARLLLKCSTNQTHIEIGWRTKLGDGLLLIHPCGIAINNECVIGENFTIYGGATIGMEFRGERRGCPKIGNKVWFGAHAAIVGNITIGDDVLIAPNAFVNFDVPSHSVVVGNPGKIVAKENATENYIIHPI